MQSCTSNTLKIFMWIVIFNLIGFVLGSLSDFGLTSWYSALSKSPLTPPNITFGIVWPILYTLLGIAAHLLHTSSISARFPHMTKRCFDIQILLNWSWTPLFFHFHQVGWSLACLFAIIALSIIVIVSCYKRCRTISLLCIPYVAWCCFASYLTLFILQHN